MIPRLIRFEIKKFLKWDSLKERREKMALKFAKKSLKLDCFSKLLPLNESKHGMNKRNPERFVVNGSNTESYRRSAIPFLQRLLNEDYSRQNKHCEILVSCSDKERNCMQAHVTACKLMELHVSSLIFIKAYVTVCRLL